MKKLVSVFFLLQTFVMMSAQNGLTHVFDPMCKQASFVCEGHLVCLSNDGHACAYPLYDRTDSTLFDLASVVYTPHCNVANLVRKGGQNYLYVSEWNGERRFFVEKITLKNGNWKTKLVRTFSLDMPDEISGAGFMDWVLDEQNGRLYTMAYESGEKGNDRIKCPVVLMEFALPKGRKDVVFTQDDILRRVVLPSVEVSQDKEIRDGRLYVAAGLRDGKHNWGPSRRIVVIDLKSLSILKQIDLSWYFDEPEGLDFIDGHLLLTFRRGSFWVDDELL